MHLIQCLIAGVYLVIAGVNLVITVHPLAPKGARSLAGAAPMSSSGHIIVYSSMYIKTFESSLADKKPFYKTAHKILQNVTALSVLFIRGLAILFLEKQVYRI